jgi:teichuronic acid biosynthesis glycosyltransferase TuaG
MNKVSVIIPTYNRFKYLINAIDSVKNQTHKSIEIIIINDCSTEKEYYEYDFKEIKIIHLPKNSFSIIGYPCPAYVRNEGIKIATGKYIAFLDDDDIWFPNKLELQINAMIKENVKMSCTDGLIGNGIYEKNVIYCKYNAEKNYNKLKIIFKNKKSNLLDNGFPKIWDFQFLQIHNCCITSSVIIQKDILDKIGYMKLLKNGEDYNYWLRVLNHTKCIYLTDICFYYDNNHGSGQNYIVSSF